MKPQSNLTAGRRCVDLVVVLLASLLVAACSGKQQGAATTATSAATPGATSGASPGVPANASAPAVAPAEDVSVPETMFESALPEDLRAALDKAYTGDLDGMVKRRLVRIGVAFNRTLYFVDKGVQRGLAYEYGKLMEDKLNEKLKTGNLKVHFAFVPLPRDHLLPALVDGKVDMVIAQLTVTPARQRIVDFTNPTRKNVDEVVVTGPGAPAIATVDDLSGKSVFVRKTSSYYQSLLELNQRLKAAGKPPVDIRAAPENLEDDDLLEMVNAGLIPITVVDNYLADFWKQVLTDMTVHGDVAVRTGGKLAVAIRKNSPQLAAGLNRIIEKFGLGTTFGNMMQTRYLQNTKYVKNATSEAERKKFLQLIELFKKYSTEYDMDYLLMAAQGFQESGLDQNVKSPVGAIGVMQVMPATGQELKVGDIRQIDANIHAGVKYIRFVEDQYFKDEPMTDINKGLFAFASYNAGPGRIRQLRKEARERGLDPNVWFGNVERVASERIGRETVTYVSNIYKYYVAYRLVLEERERRDASKEALKAAGGTQTP
jgi:membrane-bound lytic murein transglycosylase MltF